MLCRFIIPPHCRLEGTNANGYIRLKEVKSSSPCTKQRAHAQLATTYILSNNKTNISI